MKNILTNPIPAITLIIIALIALIFVPGLDFGPFLAGGALMKTLTAFVAGFVLMALVLCARIMRVLFKDGDTDDIDSSPVAKAILFGLIYLAFGVVVASVFG